MSNIPKLCRHANGQAFVKLSGKNVYVGKWGTPNAQARYDEVIAAWIANGHAEAILIQSEDANIPLAMRNLYRDPRWLALRKRVLQRDEFICVNCDKRPEDTTSMQAHHRRYLPGRSPWDYELTDLETLCQGCHAAAHGKIRPSEGWIECMEDDLGDLCGECEICATQIRYVYTIWHSNWPESFEVGCECCDAMTGLSMSRRERFVKSPRWKRYKAAAYRKHKGHAIAVSQHSDGFKVMIDGKLGRLARRNMDDAMKLAFDVIETGLFAQWRKESPTR